MYLFSQNTYFFIEIDLKAQQKFEYGCCDYLVTLKQVYISGQYSYQITSYFLKNLTPCYLPSSINAMHQNIMYTKKRRSMQIIRCLWL